MTRLFIIGALALALPAGALAQTAEQPPRVPPPPQATAPAEPELRVPVQVPPPATAAAARPGATPAATPVATAPVRPMARTGLPVDSARPRAAPAAAPPPANAVAQCVDGTFIVAPNSAAGCSSHRGVLVRFPVTAPPPRPGATATPVTSSATMRAAPVSPAQAPAGSTMQCRDGTWLSGPASAGRCDGNGGVAAILPAPRTPPPQPAPARRP